ncbi:MAG: acyltransferase [Paludibacteraceae bacterium]|nr:acyltransferase [Paludibacteraceae bacterium]
MSENYSKTIEVLRFPLLFLVVCLHSYHDSTIVIDCETPIYCFFQTLLPYGICSVAVPAFYFISGYLFFFNVEVLDVSSYVVKMKKRFKSLVVPYLIWNVIYLLLRFAIQSFLASSLSGNGKLVSEYGILDYLSIFWISDVHNFPAPIDGPLWYLRNLIIVSACSIVIYWVLKKTYLYVLIGLGAAWIFLPTGALLNQFIISFFFFSLGAFFALYKIDYLDYALKYKFPIVVVFLFTLVFMRMGFNLYNVFVFEGVVISLICAYLFAKSGKKSFFEKYNYAIFFIYASHFFISQSILRLFAKLGIVTDISLSLMMLIAPIVSVFICMLIATILKKNMPSVFRVLNGGR